MQNDQATLIVPSHDAILPYMYQGVKWAIPNVGDNHETSNAAIARLFSKVGEYLQGFSVLTDCFVPAPPTIRAVKMHHNAFVRINNLVDSATKPDSVERLEASHITHPRIKFEIKPVRYFDVKNDYCRRWIELNLQALGNMAQLSENTWSNDFSPASASEIKKLFREAYRLMCTELFNIPVVQSREVFNDKVPFFLTPEQINGYTTDHIPSLEWLKFPAIGSVFTEDELRNISVPRVQDSAGVAENLADTPQRQREQVAQGFVVQ